jgi:hypothetical protein
MRTARLQAARDELSVLTRREGSQRQLLAELQESARGVAASSGLHCGFDLSVGAQLARLCSELACLPGAGLDVSGALSAQVFVSRLFLTRVYNAYFCTFAAFFAGRDFSFARLTVHQMKPAMRASQVTGGVHLGRLWEYGVGFRLPASLAAPLPTPALTLTRVGLLDCLLGLGTRALTLPPRHAPGGVSHAGATAVSPENAVHREVDAAQAWREEVFGGGNVWARSDSRKLPKVPDPNPDRPDPTRPDPDPDPVVYKPTPLRSIPVSGGSTGSV